MLGVKVMDRTKLFEGCFRSELLPREVYRERCLTIKLSSLAPLRCFLTSASEQEACRSHRVG